MTGIDILIEEHKHILSFLESIEAECIEILNGKEIDSEVFFQAIDFIRNYADGYHHKKEEDILFKYMVENLGEIAETLVRSGMLVEHDLGRYHTKELENALYLYEEEKKDITKLSIISHAMSYVDLLRRHIEKEDMVAYTYAKRQLSKDLMDRVDQEIKQVEETEESKAIREKYMGILENL